MAKTAAKVDRTGLLRIGELAKRAGVARGTIQHYLREGLLPKPFKTHRNMAYYTPDCVDRIRLIKELQTKSYLPLSEIRDLLGDGSSTNTMAQAVVHAQESALKAISPAARSGELTLKQAAKQFGLRAGLLDEMVSVGLIAMRAGEDGEAVFTGVDLEVLAAVSKLKELGFTERAGFEPKDMLIYKKALERLLQEEVQTFMRVLSGKRKNQPPTPELARSAGEGATLLLVALRKKSIIDLLAFAEAELPELKGRKKKRSKK